MKAPRRPPPLADTLTILLPDAATTALLRACLREDGGEAAREWAGQMGSALGPDEIFAARPALRRLYPVLHDALTRASATVHARPLAVLRAGTIWEEMRTARIREILAAALPALEKAGVAPVVLKGVALAETVYPPAMRHCHDIDLLVSARDMGRAIDVLCALGFSLEDSRPRARDGTAALLHGDGLPIKLHTQLSAGLRSPLQQAMVERGRDVAIEGAKARILNPVDTLFQICARAADGNAGQSVMWTVDATLLLRAYGPTPGEWDWFVDAAVTSDLALPIHVLLRHLDQEIGAAIPERVLETLRVRAGHASWAAKDAILAAARRGARGRLTDMVARSGWRSRLAIARWMILPSPQHLAAWCEERGLRWPPVWYVGRPFRQMWIRSGGLRRLAG
jgi:hypothetical protein